MVAPSPDDSSGQDRAAEDFPALATRLALEWGAVWGLPELAERVTVAVSSRMRSSLGRCYTTRLEVRIASFVVAGPAALLREVLCHELAHAAVQMRHGPRVRPHGREWRAFMLAAGMPPRARLPRDVLADLPAPARRRRPQWEHRCPRCGASRDASRPVRRWCCARCVAAGHSGRLVITKRVVGARGIDGA